MQNKFCRFSIAVCSAVIAALVITGCSSSDDKTPLKGERISVLQFNDGAAIDKNAEKIPMQLAPEAANTAWPQPGGAATHVPGHVALSPKALKQVWRADIGSGSRKDSKLITAPIFADNRVYASDTEGYVTAFDAKDGKQLWRVSVLKSRESATVSPGLTFGNKTLFVTDGIGNVIALNPAKGDRLWSASLGQPVRGAPTYQDGRLYAVTLNDETVALDVRDGTQLWRHSGVSEMANLLGAPSPAVEGSVVVTAYGSGDIVALRAETGQEAWSDNLSGTAGAQGRAVTQLSGFRAYPVLDQGIVIAGNSSTRMAAIHVPSGERIWQKEFGISSTPWVSGNTVFAVTSQNMLVAMIRETGMIRWTTALPRFEGRSREDPIFWSGPILAGERLFVVGSNEKMLQIDPQNGKVVNTESLAGSVMIAPIVAQNTLIILTDDGDMVAYR